MTGTGGAALSAMKRSRIPPVLIRFMSLQIFELSTGSSLEVFWGSITERV